MSTIVPADQMTARQVQQVGRYIVLLAQRGVFGPPLGALRELSVACGGLVRE